MRHDRLIELCMKYDSETDIGKRHELGIAIDDAADGLSEKQLRKIIRDLIANESSAGLPNRSSMI